MSNNQLSGQKQNQEKLGNLPTHVVLQQQSLSTSV